MLLVSSGENFLRLLLVLFIFVAVLFMSYAATKWIAGFQKETMTGRNIEVIESLRISSNKVIAVVRAGKDRYLVLGIGKDEITSLGELSPEELLAGSTESTNGSYRSAQDFGAALDMFKKRFEKK